MSGTFGLVVNPGREQEQDMNIAASVSVSNWTYADILQFTKYGKSCLQPMTTAGRVFLTQLTSDTLVCISTEVWAIEPGNGGDDAADAIFEFIDDQSAAQGLMLRMAP